MKIYKCSLFLLLASISIVAEAAFDSGFFAGVSGGCQLMLDRRSQKEVMNTGTQDELADHANIREFGGNLGVLAGYLHCFESSRWCLALEGYADTIGNMRKLVIDPDDASSGSVNQNWDLGLLLKLGRFLGEDRDTVFWIFAGPQISEFSFTAQDPLMTEKSSDCRRYQLPALRIGLGIEKDLTRVRFGFDVGCDIYGARKLWAELSHLSGDVEHCSAYIHPRIFFAKIKFIIPF